MTKPRLLLYFLGLVLSTLTINKALLAEPYSEAQSLHIRDQGNQNLLAYAAYKAGNYLQAQAIWQQLAAQNNTTALNNLANLYEQSQGVEQNLTKALDYKKQSAVLGNAIAQLELGMHYQTGKGVTQDSREPLSIHEWRLSRRKSHTANVAKNQ